MRVLVSILQFPPPTLRSLARSLSAKVALRRLWGMWALYPLLWWFPKDPHRCCSKWSAFLAYPAHSCKTAALITLNGPNNVHLACSISPASLPLGIHPSHRAGSLIPAHAPTTPHSIPGTISLYVRKSEQPFLYSRSCQHNQAGQLRPAVESISVSPTRRSASCIWTTQSALHGPGLAEEARI